MPNLCKADKRWPQFTLETFTINRLSFDKTVIDTGFLTSIFEDSILTLHYKDKEFDIESKDLFTIIALEKLRLEIEAKGFLLNCNGCRGDTTYRTAGIAVGYLTYIIEYGHPATR